MCTDLRGLCQWETRPSIRHPLISCHSFIRISFYYKVIIERVSSHSQQHSSSQKKIMKGEKEKNTFLLDKIFSFYPEKPQ